jgi:hypothetical protein
VRICPAIQKEKKTILGLNIEDPVEKPVWAANDYRGRKKSEG